ncbi:uncharacterized protein [Littorina saxatilis]|uniref:Uncharacterized protein n=1 Tax=Littorina saxatilis TaxID=31220 RepID=A0AAN9AIT2_9CAEN
MAFTVLARYLLLGLGLYFALAADLTVDLRTGNSTGGGDYLTWVEEPYQPAFDFDQDCSWQAVLKMTFHKKERRRAEIKMVFDNSTFLSFNLGDSITNDGFAGDDGTQSNNAEVHSYGSELYVVGRDHKLTSYGILYTHMTYFTVPEVTMNVKDTFFRAVNDLGVVHYDSKELFRLKGQSDKKGDTNFDLYLGMNRAIKNNTFRTGAGLCSVEITWHKR